MSADPTRAEAIFLAAADLPDPAQRAAYLNEACGPDADLRRRVDALLRAHDQPDSLLDAPVVGPADGGATRSLPADAPDDTRTANPVPDDADDALAFLSPPGRPDSLGRLGPYEMLEVLGKGGFGVVFRAFDTVLQRVVAVKVLAPAIAATSPARKRFVREAQSTAKVRHENVVHVYAVGEAPLPHLVMEFVPGETLQQLIDRTGPLDAPEVLRIGRQVAEGLAAAHATGLIHRDVKPSNILTDGGPQRRVKLTDFGLARAADDASLTRSGVVAGTPMYMAPEQARGEALDHRADLFSLGSVLYVMCTGRPPFRAATTLAVLKRVAEDDPRPVREVIPEVPEWLARVVEALHAKDPARRIQTAREVADVLADCEAQLAERAAVTDFSRLPAGQPRRRRRWWPAVVAAVAMLLVLIVGWFGIRSPAATDTGRLVVEVREPGVRLEVFATGRGDTKRVVPPSGESGVRFDERLPVGEWNVVAHRGPADPPYHRRVVLGPDGIVVAVPATPETGAADGPRVPEPVDLVRWGTFVNPRQFPSILREPRAVTIHVPGDQSYDLLPLPGHNYDAPRVVRAFDGDFRVEVTVPPFPPPVAGTVAAGRHFSYVAAGLLVWADERTLLRFGRAAIGEHENGTPYLHGEWYATGERRGDERGGRMERPDAPLHLQVERKGSAVHLRWRQDDAEWRDWRTAADLNLPDRVSVGFVANNTTTREFSPRFENLAVLGSLPAGSNEGGAGVVTPLTSSARSLAGWGDVVDPLGDCRVGAGNGRLTITVPGGGRHGLNPLPQWNNLNAPRVVRAVAGDFEARVTIPEPPRPAGANPADGDTGAGLVVWADDRQFLRLLAARAGEVRAEWFHGASGHGRHDHGVLVGPLHLRVRRAGGTLHLASSTDRRTWWDLPPVTDLPLGATVRVGVAAVNTTGGEFAPAFEDYEVRLTPPPAPAPGTVTLPLPPNSWEPLFNGKDLTGWTSHPTQANEFAVDGGELVGRGVRGGHLFTERDTFADFHLRAEMKVNDTGNGGLYFRAPFDLTPNGFPNAPEVQIHNDPAGDPQKTGSIHNIHPYGKVLVPDERWFTLEVIAKGTHVTVKVNGTTTVDAPVTDPRFPATHGRFALQCLAGTELRVRKIVVKNLGAPSFLDLAAAQHRQNQVTLRQTEYNNVSARFAAGVVGRLDVIAAEVKLLDAKVELAAATEKPAEVVRLLEELVTRLRERRRLTEERVTAGVVLKEALNPVDADIAAAEARLARAKLSATNRRE